MSPRTPPVPAPAEDTGEPAILARLDRGVGWGALLAAGGWRLAAGGAVVVAGLGVLAFRRFSRRREQVVGPRSLT